jgi:hypothetical protein
MQEDPILAEVRRLREEYAASLNHDAEAIYQDILRRQRHSGRKLVRYPPRQPRAGVDSAKRDEPAIAE